MPRRRPTRKPIRVELAGFRPSIEQLETQLETFEAIAADLRAQIAARRGAGAEAN